MERRLAGGAAAAAGRLRTESPERWPRPLTPGGRWSVGCGSAASDRVAGACAAPRLRLESPSLGRSRRRPAADGAAVAARRLRPELLGLGPRLPLMSRGFGLAPAADNSGFSFALSTWNV